MKKIMFITGSMGRGGGERVISILSEHFNSIGCETHIVMLLEFKCEYKLSDDIVLHDLTPRSGAPVIKKLIKWMSGIRRLVGLDGKAKMSKSLNNAVFLSDSSEQVDQKIRNAVTDPARIRKTDPGHPEICTVFEYHRVFNAGEAAEIESDCRSGSIGCVACKKRLAHQLNSMLEPMRERRGKYQNNPKQVKEILMEGTRKAHSVARETMVEVRQAMNINYFDHEIHL
jgi:tryptophanyl-tRNA synthetase